jgi:hypothetical protein
MYLIKAKTKYKTTRKVNNVVVTETQSASATTEIKAATATLTNVNNAILLVVSQSNASAINASGPINSAKGLKNRNAKKLGGAVTIGVSETDFTTSTGSSITPWSGGVINGYFMWQGNFVNYSPTTQYFAYTVSKPQTNPTSSTIKSNITYNHAAYNYTSDVTPPDTDVSYNAIFMFSGASNVTDALNANINYTTGTNNYTTARNYFTNAGISNYLLSLTIGGGYDLTGSWNTGSAGAIYSLYQAVTSAGSSFGYVETGTGKDVTLTGVGLGTLYPINQGTMGYNSICLDIETWGAGPGADPSGNYYGSSGQDFLNVCNYIKRSPRSLFSVSGCTIILTIAHSCSNYNGTGYDTITTILSDASGSYDYISPQLYTTNVGTTTEYTQNSNLPWNNQDPSNTTNFLYFLNKNLNFQTYGGGFILPALNFLGLLTAGGSNDGNAPNLYWYESSTSSTTPPVFSPNSYASETISNYSSDTGTEDFFEAVFGDNALTLTQPLGGAIQWVNGSLNINVYQYPYPWKSKPIVGMALWSDKTISNTAVNYYSSVLYPQYFGPTYSSNLQATSGTFAYNGNIPTGTNTVHLYTNYSNASDAVDYSGVSDWAPPFLTAYDYFNSSSYTGAYILSLALGGSTSDGYWNTGTSGSVYSVYVAATNSGASFSYIETGTGITLTGKGTGILNNNFNGLLFDIESYNPSTASSSGVGSSGQDFINLFQYIKYNPNSKFYGFQMLITVSFPHAGADYNGNGASLMSTILADASGNQSGKYSYDFLAPKLFSGNNVGTMNEYCSGNTLPWTATTGTDSFLSYAQQNSNFNIFNVNMLTPFVLTSNLVTGPGTNTTGLPNKYWSQNNSTNDTPQTAAQLATQSLGYATDLGSTNFLNLTLASQVTTSGGYVQWMNGSIS